MSRELEQSDTDGAEFNRRSVLKATGVAIGAGATGALATGTASASKVCAGDCVRLGKLDRTPRQGDTLEFELNGTTVTIRIESVRTEDGEVVGFTFRGGQGRICRVEVKGGPNTRVLNYCEGTSGGSPNAPDHEKNPNRTYYEISNIVFYWCVDTGGDGINDCPCDDESCVETVEKNVGGGPPDDKGGPP